ncbi:MAG: redox-sensing transcriptional repressor Rex [Oscillospiraceae bacterium]|nr:redox-sensing transcriptional repressor Rex [Oscillospiraceae bacterium]
MPKRSKISMSVIRRLPRYYRFLNQLDRDGVTRISSTELSARLGLTASQIRQDLNCFGGFGQQGYGYMVHQLAQEIGIILGIEHRYRTVIFGAGNIGHAIAAHMDFEELGFHLTGIFDNDPAKIGSVINGIEVLDTQLFDEFYQKHLPEMAILCIPRSAMKETVERLYALGIRNYWNFSHYDISMKYPDAVVENVHLNDSLLTLCYQISNQKKPVKKPVK